MNIQSYHVTIGTSSAVTESDLKFPLYRFYRFVRFWCTTQKKFVVIMPYLVKRFGVNRSTVNRWIRALVELGLLTERPATRFLRRALCLPPKRAERAPAVRQSCATQNLESSTYRKKTTDSVPTPPPAPAPPPAEAVASLSETPNARSHTSPGLERGGDSSGGNVRPQDTAITRELQQAGVSADYAAIAAQKASQGQLRALLRRLRETQGIRNPGGWLRRCIENQWFPQEQAAGRHEDGTAERIKRDLEAAGQARQVDARSEVSRIRKLANLGVRT